MVDEFLGCMVFSRSRYDDYAVKDIITLVQFINETSFRQAINWLCSKLNIDNTYETNNTSEIGLATELRKLKNKKNRSSLLKVEHEILPIETLNKYKKYIVQEWEKEGITKEIQEKYLIRIDEYKKRWLIPIFDDQNNLISIKGRSYLPNIKELDIPKYWYYYKIGYNDILFGLNFNKQNIKRKNEIILFEGEKYVMKADAYGYDWCCSVGKCGINPNIKKKILGLKCDVVIAFDKDVPIKSIYKEAYKISSFTNVYAIFDKCNLLDIDNKDSPVDKGKDIFDTLYNSKIRIR
jgi:DNA primase